MIENPYCFFNSAIDNNTCDQILEIGKNKQLKEGTTKGEEYQNYRKSRIAWLKDDLVLKIAHDFVVAANKEANWNFELDFLEPVQFTEYKTGQFYNWHEDCLYKEKYSRKISMVLKLTDPSEYVGGDLQLYNYIKPTAEKTAIITNDVWRNRGTVIVFPSFILHRVTKILEGTRHSLVAWFSGKPWR